MWPAQTPGTWCTCVWSHLSVPGSASQHPSPGPHTSHRLQTSDKGRGEITRVKEIDLSYCHLSYWAPLWSNPHSWRDWQQNKKTKYEGQYLRLYMASLETCDVCGQFADIMKINLTQAIVVMYPQLESKVVMTNRWRERVWGEWDGWDGEALQSNLICLYLHDV